MFLRIAVQLTPFDVELRLMTGECTRLAIFQSRRRLLPVGSRESRRPGVPAHDALQHFARSASDTIGAKKG